MRLKRKRSDTVDRKEGNKCASFRLCLHVVLLCCCGLCCVPDALCVVVAVAVVVVLVVLCVWYCYCVCVCVCLWFCVRMGLLLLVLAAVVAVRVAIVVLLRHLQNNAHEAL